MPTKNISMTDEQASRVEAMVRSGRYATASDYVRDLIRRDTDRDQAREQLAQLLLESLEDGQPGKLVTESYLTDLKKRAMTRINKPRKRAAGKKK